MDQLKTRIWNLLLSNYWRKEIGNRADRTENKNIWGGLVGHPKVSCTKIYIHSYTWLGFFHLICSKNIEK